MIGTFLSGTIALVLPLFASYRALISNDISLIRPWLMYWVVFASFEFVESAFRPILSLIPFYGLARLGFLLWLVLPQTQGAVQLYQTRIEPYLSGRDQYVDQAITRVFEWIRNSPLSSILALLGIDLPKPPPASGPAGSGPASAQGSITDAFMSRFRLPSSPDFNLAAYLPSMTADGSNGEYKSIMRNSLLGMIKSLDGSSESVTTAAREVDGFDFVETPKSTPQPGETEIEREIEDKLLHARTTGSTQPEEPRRRGWF